MIFCKLGITPMRSVEGSALGVLRLASLSTERMVGWRIELAVLDEPGLHDERRAGNDGGSSRSSSKGCGVGVGGVARPAVAGGVDAVAPTVTVDAAPIVGKAGTRMRRGGIGSADHDRAGIPEVVAVAVEDELAVGILVGVEVVRAIASGFHDDDAVGSGILDGVEGGLLDFHRKVARHCGRGGLRFEQEHIAAFHDGGGAEDGFGGVVGAGVAPLRNNAGRGERRDADSADGVVDHNDFTEDGGAMSGVVVVDAGDDANACGDQVFMVECPASLHVDKADAAAVGLRPSPAHVDACGRGVFVMLIGVARIVGGIDRRRSGSASA